MGCQIGKITCRNPKITSSFKSRHCFFHATFVTIDMTQEFEPIKDLAIPKQEVINWSSWLRSSLVGSSDRPSDKMGRARPARKRGMSSESLSEIHHRQLHLLIFTICKSCSPRGRNSRPWCSLWWEVANLKLKNKWILHVTPRVDCNSLGNKRSTPVLIIWF